MKEWVECVQSAPDSDLDSRCGFSPLQIWEMKFLESSVDKDADSASSVVFLLWYMIQMLLNDERAEARRALAGWILVLCVRLSVCVTNTGLFKRRR